MSLKEIITNLSKEVIRTGQLKKPIQKRTLDVNPNCPLREAIVVPLMTNGNVAGTLKFYFTDYNHITTSTKQLARGLADIFQVN